MPDPRTAQLAPRGPHAAVAGCLLAWRLWLRPCHPALPGSPLAQSGRDAAFTSVSHAGVPLVHSREPEDPEQRCVPTFLTPPQCSPPAQTSGETFPWTL